MRRIRGKVAQTDELALLRSKVAELEAEIVVLKRPKQNAVPRPVGPDNVLWNSASSLRDTERITIVKRYDRYRRGVALQATNQNTGRTRSEFITEEALTDRYAGSSILREALYAICTDVTSNDRGREPSFADIARRQLAENAEMQLESGLLTELTSAPIRNELVTAMMQMSPSPQRVPQGILREGEADGN